jgi:hypothetical protein
MDEVDGLRVLFASSCINGLRARLGYIKARTIRIFLLSCPRFYFGFLYAKEIAIVRAPMHIISSGVNIIARSLPSAVESLDRVCPSE